MDKNRMLLIGCGKTGNVLINEMMKLDVRYTGLFVNSEYSDMASLEKFSPKSAFVFNNANGSGKNRDMAKSYLIDQIQSLVDKVVSYPLHDVITIFTSADGGTGSGITPSLISLMHTTFERKNLDKKINLVAVMPNCDESDKLSLDNAIAFWNEIMKIRETCIDDIKFIDNTRGDSYREINELATIALNNSYSMNGKDPELGEIDNNDAKRFNCSKGFGLVLTLPENAPSTKRAIEIAINNSVFAIPNSYASNYLGVSLKRNKEGITKYNYSEIKNFFQEVHVTNFKTSNPKHSTIVLGGCSAPKDMIDMINEINEDLKRKMKERELKNEAESLIIETDSVSNSKIQKNEGNALYTDEDLEDIANDVLSVLDNLF